MGFSARTLKDAPSETFVSRVERPLENPCGQQEVLEGGVSTPCLHTLLSLLVPSVKVLLSKNFPGLTEALGSTPFLLYGPFAVSMPPPTPTLRIPIALYVHIGLPLRQPAHRRASQIWGV